MARAVCEGRKPPPSVPGIVNYLLPFHMLAAGPIQSYDDFCLQPATPVRLTTDESLVAFEWIAGGLFKKYVLAAFLERFLLTGFQSGGAYTLVEMQLNYVWLYLDFSGYSETAWGVGRLMGVATPINFNRPLMARNSIEFWERWHMSLSQFIRTHLFFPVQLGLMRLTDGRRPLAIACLAFTVSFLACGLWHGIGWTWLAWGAWQAAGLVAVTLYKQILTDRLGRKGVKEYLTRPWIRRGAILLTFEFQAFAVLIVTYPFSW